MKLSDLAIRNLKPGKKPKKYADGHGLYLLVRPSGSKLWQMAFRFKGRQKTLSFGPYPLVTLAAARQKRDEARLALLEGRDPTAKLEAPEPVKVLTFAQIAEEWFENYSRTGAPKYNRCVWQRLRDHVLPVLGDRPAAEIRPSEVVQMLDRIVARGTITTSHKCREYVDMIYRAAKPRHDLVVNPASDLARAIAPRPEERPKLWLRPREVPGFFAALLAPHRDSPVTRIALELQMHVVLRGGELRMGRWSEIVGAEWRIAAPRMKVKVDHIVPLSAQARELLAQLRTFTGDSEWLFPKARGTGCMSENTVQNCIERLGYTSAR